MTHQKAMAIFLCVLPCVCLPHFFFSCMLATPRFRCPLPPLFSLLPSSPQIPLLPPSKRRGPDDGMPQDIDWGDSDDLFGNAQDVGAFYAQVGWDPGAAAAAGGGGTIAVAGGGGGGRRGVPQVFQQAGGGGGGDGGEAWVARGAQTDHLSMWGVQPPPGLARQYATRHGDRAGGMVRRERMSNEQALFVG